MRWEWWVILGLGCGCAETPLEVATIEPWREEAPPIQQNAELAPPADSFWLTQAITEMHKPAPMRPQSISLGYVGDAPLSGGVMRDTPMATPAPDPNSLPAQAPASGCSCDLPPSSAADAYMAR
jgi:hypothetical protein